MEIQLRRRGVAKTVTGYTVGGSYCEIGYHHGGNYWYCEIETKHKRPGKLDSYGSKHIKLEAGSLEEAIIEAQEHIGEVAPEIEAYCYNNKKCLEIWPHAATDVFFTCATYEPGTDTIRHEPTNYCLIHFEEDRGIQYPHEQCNKKYTKEIQKGLDCYNSNVAAHGVGVERKEWLAWLVGQYIREIEGEKPKKTNSISR